MKHGALPVTLVDSNMCKCIRHIDTDTVTDTGTVHNYALTHKGVTVFELKVHSTQL